MTILQATVLGVVQGLTEFLPVSSSGHLILVPALLGWNVQSLAFDTVLHLGTALSLIIFFRKDLFQVLRSPKLLKLLLVGSIPAAVIGFVLGGSIESIFRSSISVTTFLLVGSALMYFAEMMYKKVWDTERISQLEEVDMKKGFLVGIFQSLALLSGFSRSGATISGGMLLGLQRKLAARFSFLLSIPIVLGAGFYKVLNAYELLSLDWPLIIGFFTSFLVGLFAIDILLKFLEKNTLMVFVVYRVILAVVVLIISYL